MCYLTGQAQKIIKSHCFYLISNSWWNPRQRPRWQDSAPPVIFSIFILLCFLFCFVFFFSERFFLFSFRVSTQIFFLHCYHAVELLTRKNKGGPMNRRFKKPCEIICFNIFSCMIYDLLYDYHNCYNLFTYNSHIFRVSFGSSITIIVLLFLNSNSFKVRTHLNEFS